MSIWSGVLDSCPGLLCCVINMKGLLLYATHGYKAVAARLFGHKCEEGRSYPPLLTELDQNIHEALTAACLGDANAFEFSEGNNVWELTASPLYIDDSGVSGVVLRVSSANANGRVQVAQTNPDILNAVPFRACVVDSDGAILAANRFLILSLGLDPTGNSITRVVDISPEDSGLMDIISAKSGSVECSMSDTTPHENFYTFTAESVYLDEKHNTIAEPEPDSSRRIRLHASPIDWSGKHSVLLTFEDITDATKAREQLRRLLTYDSPTGILNRRGLEHIILREVNDAVKNSGDLSLICLSLDTLGQLTELLGWDAGEQAVHNFVRSMMHFLDGRDIGGVGVWDRGEFMVLAHCTGAVSVVIANEIRDRAGTVVSAGVADFARGAYSGVSDFIAGAYDAMNSAKLDGGNRTALADR